MLFINQAPTWFNVPLRCQARSGRELKIARACTDGPYAWLNSFLPRRASPGDMTRAPRWCLRLQQFNFKAVQPRRDPLPTSKAAWVVKVGRQGGICCPGRAFDTRCSSRGAHNLLCSQMLASKIAVCGGFPRYPSLASRARLRDARTERAPGLTGAYLQPRQKLPW